MIYFSPLCLEYCSEGHPESPERVRAIYVYLREKKYVFDEAKPCQDEDILLVHTQDHLERVKKNKFYDPDTPNLEGIYKYALLSAGGALQAMESALQGESSFSLLRPPGHHATRNSLGGFCYFNNIAIATAKALGKVAKVAILDFDGHHGNGTQDIFQVEERVIYLSFHQSPAYPGTGIVSESNCFNFPLIPGARESQFLPLFEEALEKIERFNPALIAVSAGFDGYKKEGLLNLGLEIDTYFKIGRGLRELNQPIFAVLEGGYHQDLPLCVERFLQGIKIG